MSPSPSSFFAEAWSRNAALDARTRALPFNVGLAAGDLGPDAFRHGIVQDATYLIAFGQASAVAAAEADDPDHIAGFAAAACEAVVVERALHEDCFGRFGLTPAAGRSGPHGRRRAGRDLARLTFVEPGPSSGPIESRHGPDRHRPRRALPKAA